MIGTVTQLRAKHMNTSDPINTNKSLRVVMIGATGAVGQQVVTSLLAQPALQKLTLLGRRGLPEIASPKLEQHVVDVMNPARYAQWLSGHDAAICTLGVGQPSKVSKEEFVRVDKDSVIAFATACKQEGVKHFELLNAVGADATSRSLYLRTKGELCDALVALGFERLSIFAPSMILTLANRYGASQALMLAVWPKLDPILGGAWRKYRGVTVEILGAAMAANLHTPKLGLERLHWQDFMVLTGHP
jgi:uncharacterized protein YbjT (DUF2867 family)